MSGTEYQQPRDNREPFKPLTPREYQQLQRLLSDPFSYPPELYEWIKNKIEQEPPAITWDTIVGFAQAVNNAVDLGGYVPVSIVDAKGDLLVGSAADAIDNLPGGTDGHVLTRDSSQALGVKWAAAAAGPGAPATSLPASPVNGQQAILVDSTSAPTYAWLFQYSTGISDANKWVFLGGAPAVSEVPANEGTSATSPTDLATVGPSITVPRAGIYQAAFGARVGSGNGGEAANMCLARNGTVMLETANYQATGGHWVGLAYQGWIAATGAGDVMRCKYYNSFGGGSDYYKRWLNLIPVRVA